MNASLESEHLHMLDTIELQQMYNKRKGENINVTSKSFLRFYSTENCLIGNRFDTDCIALPSSYQSIFHFLRLTITVKGSVESQCSIDEQQR